MKKFVLLSALLAVLVSLGGCYWPHWHHHHRHGGHGYYNGSGYSHQDRGHYGYR